MKLVHNNIEKHFDFKLNNFQFLVIENSDEYFKLTDEIFAQANGEEGGWVLSEDGRILDFKNKVLVIYDYYSLDVNNKKIQNFLNEEALRLIKSNDYIAEFAEINKKIIELNEKIIQKFDVSVYADKEFCYEDFVKLSGYKISESNNFLENLMSYIDIYIKLKKIKLVVFFNLTSILNSDKLKCLVKQLRYDELSALFIDTQSEKCLNEFERTIIDEDLCII